MKRIEYFFSPDGKIFLPLGRSLADENARDKAQELVNSRKRNFSIPLWRPQILLAKRIMPEKNKKTRKQGNKENISPGRIQFLIAPLGITRENKKIILSISGEFYSQDGHAKGL